MPVNVLTRTGRYASTLPKYGKSRYAATAERLSSNSPGVTMDLKQHIRSIPDFPKPGILFYDISTLLAHPDAWPTTVQLLSEALRPHQPDMLVGIESRGLLVAAPLAYALSRRLAMIPQKGNL